MTKKLLVLALLSMLSVACGGNNPVAPEVSLDNVPVATATPTPDPMPAWVLAFEGRIVQPKDGTYEVYFGRGIGDDPEVATYTEQVLAAANQLTAGRVRFVRGFHSNATLTMAIAPELMQNPTALAQNAVVIEKPSYLIKRGDITFRAREFTLTNTSLHEIGHFLFGPGHSTTEGDVMGPRDYSRLSFSANEFSLWPRIHAAGPGATIFSRSEVSDVTIITD